MFFLLQNKRMSLSGQNYALDLIILMQNNYIRTIYLKKKNIKSYIILK